MILLDTHAWLWWVGESDQLSRKAKTTIDRASSIGVSVISCWEVAMLVEKRRISLDRDVESWMQAALALDRVELLDLTPEVAIRSTQLQDFHEDPADRILTATALLDRRSLVTKDRKIRSYPLIQTIW